MSNNTFTNIMKIATGAAYVLIGYVCASAGGKAIGEGIGDMIVKSKEAKASLEEQSK